MFQSNQKLDNLDFSKFNNIIFHGLQTAHKGRHCESYLAYTTTVTLGVLKEMKF